MEGSQITGTTVLYKNSPSNKATLFAKNLWPHLRGGLQGEGERKEFARLERVATVERPLNLLKEGPWYIGGHVKAHLTSAYMQVVNSFCMTAAQIHCM